MRKGHIVIAIALHSMLTPDYRFTEHIRFFFLSLFQCFFSLLWVQTSGQTRKNVLFSFGTEETLQLFFVFSKHPPR